MICQHFRSTSVPYFTKDRFQILYRIGSKDPTGASKLDALGKFIAEHGIPRKIIMDHDGKVGAGKKWKDYLGRLFLLLCLSEPDKHNHNLVERAI